MISDFNILNPKINNMMPFFAEKNGIFYFRVLYNYKYYLECSAPNSNNDIEYYILLSITKFDSSCRACHVDKLNRCQIHPKGEMLNYIRRECAERGNIECNLFQQRSNYDIYKLK